MNKAKSTLVKSRPELWGMLDEPERMRGWSASLVDDEVEIEVTQREEEQRLCWTAAVASEVTSIEVALEESGWGTKVLVSAEGPVSAEGFDAWAADLFEELGSASRRPFSRGQLEDAPKEAPPAEPEAPAEPEEPVEAEAAAPDDRELEAAPREQDPPPRRRRRWFFR